MHVCRYLTYIKDLRHASFTKCTDRNICVNKYPTRCNSMQIFIYCKVTPHVSGVTAPISRSTKNCVNKNTGAATSFQHGPIWPRWKEVAVPVLWPVTKAAVTVFSTPDDGCCDTRNMYSDFISVINQLDTKNFCFTISLFHASTCF